MQRALDQIDAVRETVARHPNDLVLCTTAEEIRRAKAAGKIAVLMGVEGGHMINNSLANLDKFFALGVRYMTLTHTVNTDWADASTDKAAHNGLTDFGKQVVREMNRLGMMVDISHVADKTFYDVLAVSKAPVIASHSSCRALCNAPRNMTDDMIKALAAKGGVIQINYHIGFLSQQFQDASKAHPELGKEIEAEAKKRCGENEACQLIEADKITREMVAQGKLPRVDWTEIVKHIDHAVKLVGADHVGLGSDFDGADMPYGMEDASDIPRITECAAGEGLFSRRRAENSGWQYAAFDAGCGSCSPKITPIIIRRKIVKRFVPLCLDRAACRSGSGYDAGAKLNLNRPRLRPNRLLRRIRTRQRLIRTRLCCIPRR